MFEFTLPELKKIWWKRVGNKNSVEQLLAKEVTGQFAFVSSHRGYSIIEKEGIQFCLVTNITKVPEGYDYILQTNKKASEDSLIDGEIIIKDWIIHPELIDYTNEEIIERTVYLLKNKNIADALGKKGQEHVLREFSEESKLQNYLDMFKKTYECGNEV